MAGCDFRSLGVHALRGKGSPNFLGFGTRGSGRLLDELGGILRMRHVDHMACAAYLDGLGIGALGHHSLLNRIDRSVFGCDHVPGGLGLPRGIGDLVVKESVEIGT